MLMNEFQLTGFTLLVASFVFIPQVNADLRDEFKQEQTQKQKDYQKKLDYCSLGIALAQFKSGSGYYYIENNQVLEIVEHSDDRICSFRRLSDLGAVRKFEKYEGFPESQSCYIEGEELVCYTKDHVYKKTSRYVIGVKK